MHAQTHMHTSPRSIMSAWLCVVSEWCSPPSADAAVTAVWISKIQRWLDWLTGEGTAKREPRGEGVSAWFVCVCTYAYSDCGRARGAIICNVCVCGMWKWLREGGKKKKGGESERRDQERHVGWIRHFLFKKWRSWRPDENLGVNKEELLVTPAPLGPPRPVTSGWIRGHLGGNTQK